MKSYRFLYIFYISMINPNNFSLRKKCFKLLSLSLSLSLSFFLNYFLLPKRSKLFFHLCCFSTIKEKKITQQKFFIITIIQLLISFYSTYFLHRQLLTVKTLIELHKIHLKKKLGNLIKLIIT